MNYSVNKEETVTIEVDKSKFIGIIKNFKNLAEFNDFLEKLIAKFDIICKMSFKLCLDVNCFFMSYLYKSFIKDSFLKRLF